MKRGGRKVGYLFFPWISLQFFIAGRKVMLCVMSQHFFCMTAYASRQDGCNFKMLCKR